MMVEGQFEGSRIKELNDGESLDAGSSCHNASASGSEEWEEDKYSPYSLRSNAPERNDLLELDDVLQEAGGALEGHVADCSGGLARVLVVHS